MNNNRFYLRAFERSIAISITFLLFIVSATAQVSITAIPTPASCSSNGSISATATGGSGDYTYQLISTCLPIPQINTTGLFQALPPCAYTILVTDGAGGNSDEITINVAGDYQPVGLDLICGGCAIEAITENGVAPFNYSISTTGQAGSFIANSPPENPIFENLTSGTVYWIQVADACGLATSQCQTGGNPITNLGMAALPDGSLEVVTITGGTGNLEYSITSNVGTFSNTTGIFPPDEWGCNVIVTVSDGCYNYSEPYDVNPSLQNFCVNFSEGSVEVTPIASLPYVITAITPDGNFTFNNNQITGLPINASSYRFRIVDGCGNISTTYGPFYPKSIAFPNATIADCQDTTLSLVAFNGNCEPGDFNTPLEITCLSCPDVPTQVINNNFETMTFSGNQIGDWEIAVINDCGDTYTCTDDMILRLNGYCDSLKATLVDRFQCNNGTSSDRILSADGNLFYLLDDNGAVIDSSLNGVFTDLTPALYSVRIDHQTCGSFEATTSVGDSLDLIVNMSHYIQVRNINGACKITYNIRVSSDQGPLWLTGNGVQIRLDENDLTSGCLEYFTNNLLPGAYTLEAINFCGATNFYLPEPTFDLQAVADGTCPGAGSITVTGAQTYSEWYEWRDTAATSANINFNWNGFIDHYTLDVTGGNAYTHNGSPYSFFNVSPGEHTAYLYAFGNNNCPVDTATAIVPEPVLPEFSFSNGTLCDGELTTSVTATFTGGKPPYTLQLMNCDDLTEVVQTIVTTYDTMAVLDNLFSGNYCYRLLDDCLTSRDVQLSINSFQDEINVNFLCNNTISMRVDSLINTSYTWVDSNGNQIGNTNQVTINNPEANAAFTVYVDMGFCSLSRSVNLPMTEIIPTSTISGDSLLCAIDTITLSANTSANSFVWNTGTSDPQIYITDDGVYSLTVTNDLGCTNTSSFEVLQIPLSVPEIIGDLSNCIGDTAYIWIPEDYVAIQWSNGIANDSVAILAAGNWSATITDEFGCNWENTIDVFFNPLPEPIISGDSAVCENESTLLSLNQNYMNYLWSDGSTQANLLATEGTYQITVTDGNGCKADTVYTVAEIPTVLILLTGDTLLCKDSTAYVSIMLENETNPVQLFWNTALITSPLTISQDTVLSFLAQQNSSVFINSATMANYNCPFHLPDAVDILTNQPLVNVTSAIDYNGYTVSCAGAADGAISAEAFAGIPPYSFEWNNGDQLPLLSDLTPGEYMVTVTDSLQCSTFGSIVLTPPAPIQPIWENHPPLCFDIDDGRIEITNWTGGVNEIDVFINGSSLGFAPIELANLSPGEYQIEITDANNCWYDTLVTFYEPLKLNVDLGEDLLIPLGEELQIKPTINFATVDSFVWQPTTYLLDESFRPWCKPLSEVEYHLQVWNENNCFAEDRLLIRVDKSPIIFVPNVFSPNGDGKNDLFTIFSKPGSVDLIQELEIFDRWGEKVFGKTNFPPDDLSQCWDGYLNGKPLHAGVYIYIAHVKFVDGRVELISGDVTIIR